MLIDIAVFVAYLDNQNIHVKLGDFGFARFDTDKTQTYVQTGFWQALVGLLPRHVDGFTTPTTRDSQEQRHSNENFDSKRRTTLKSDIYSFGRKPARSLDMVTPHTNNPSDHAGCYAPTRSVLAHLSHR